MLVRNINEAYGEPVEFDSVEEMLECVNLMAQENEDFETVDNLDEGTDYEVVELNENPEEI